MAVFGVIALLLAAVGVFGLVAYSVARRTREIGVCLAIGAQKSDVFWSVLKEGLLVGCAGVALGLPLSFLLTRGLGTLLYGVTATDPAALISMPSLLIAICLLASVVPAWRAASLEPSVALRVYPCKVDDARNGETAAFRFSK
jgi:ABC-type antimicrobial peptide transport system permease subunit